MKSVIELWVDIKSDLCQILIDGKILSFGFIVATLLSFIKTYLFADTKYLIWLLIVIILDVFSKLYKLWFIEKKKPELEVLINKLLNKTLKYAIYLITSYVLVNFEVDGKKLEFLTSINPFVYGILIVKDVNSIMNNIGMKLPKVLQDIIDDKFNLEKDGKENKI